MSCEANTKKPCVSKGWLSTLGRTNPFIEDLGCSAPRFSCVVSSTTHQILYWQRDGFQDQAEVATCCTQETPAWGQASQGACTAGERAKLLGVQDCFSSLDPVQMGSVTEDLVKAAGES